MATFVILKTSMGSDQMTAENPLFQKVETLKASRPFDRTKLEELFDMKLSPSPTTQTQYFTVFKTDEEQAGSGSVDAIELRMPTAKSDKTDGLVILSVNADLCIKRHEVADWMGQPGEQEPPRANVPASMPAYVRHQHDWGVMSFGFSRTEPKCLRSIVLDAT